MPLMRDASEHLETTKPAAGITGTIYTMIQRANQSINQQRLYRYQARNICEQSSSTDSMICSIAVHTIYKQPKRYDYYLFVCSSLSLPCLNEIFAYPGGAQALADGVHNGHGGCGKLFLATDAPPSVLRGLRGVQVCGV